MKFLIYLLVILIKSDNKLTFKINNKRQRNLQYSGIEIQPTVSISLSFFQYFNICHL